MGSSPCTVLTLRTGICATATGTEWSASRSARARFSGERHPATPLRLIYPGARVSPASVRLVERADDAGCFGCNLDDASRVCLPSCLLKAPPGGCIPEVQADRLRLEV